MLEKEALLELEIDYVDSSAGISQKMSEETSGLTVGEAIAAILPNGTLDYLDADAETERNESKEETPQFDWQEPPLWPTDLFAVAAHVIQSSGVLTYFDPDPEFVHKVSDRPLGFTLTSPERSQCHKAGREWSENPEVPTLVYRLWRKFVRAWDDRLRASSYTYKARRKKAPDWWSVAVQLLILADEACIGLGAPPIAAYPNRWLVDFFQFQYAKPFRRDNRLKRLNGHRADRQPTSFGIDSDADVGCVQPKGRIAAVGCNLRNLTAHLAFLPHAGNVRCHWQQPMTSTINNDTDTLDILIVPLPLHLEDSWIRRSTTATPNVDTRPNWGNFEINQRWLEDEDRLVDLVMDEMKKAKAELGSNNVNGVIFPEYALNESIFNRICDELKLIEPSLEFAICGSSSNCDGENGNFVLTALWYASATDSRGRAPSKYLLTSRRKHHRWRINGSQIHDYNLTSALDADVSWWETHRIAQREIHFFHFRQTSVFTSMICEDLARSDPCHDILRSVGPNLLFALLMDGPQRNFRWPARYASTLAEDPGTSVLTVTSLALVTRSNLTYSSDKIAIAMWRDETGDVQELCLDPGDKSLLLKLTSVSVRDQTLDGRVHNDARSWRFQSAVSLK
ncbi:hypothetical protein [Rhizobium leguminosarum]|uniref:hypothetical protein n=1 Tax=Rhizobium TaxID=379 RepID=UPI001031C012|nr:hypothetical protein [Rhizobium leguminosarum]QIO53904.1 hypothetical protein HA461_23220 [Rhizobium leguminosarum bv. trifolii]TBH13937.1 hypothetical protein ELG68_23645 [Rhizobium leguminosarum]